MLSQHFIVFQTRTNTQKLKHNFIFSQDVSFLSASPPAKRHIITSLTSIRKRYAISFYLWSNLWIPAGWGTEGRERFSCWLTETFGFILKLTLQLRSCGRETSFPADPLSEVLLDWFNVHINLLVPTFPVHTTSPSWSTTSNRYKYIYLTKRLNRESTAGTNNKEQHKRNVKGF